MLLRLLKLSILSSVNSILWNILLNIPLSWCWMSLKNCRCHTILDFSRLSISSQYVIQAIQPGGWLLMLKFRSTIVFIVMSFYRY